jgi:hypothetical protein
MYICPQLGISTLWQLFHGNYSAFQMSVQDCDITDDWPLMADHRVKINNERLAQSACVFFLSRQ